MTDEIKITRRIALDRDYEFYEFQLTIIDPKENDVDSAIELFEKKVKKIRKVVGEPSPEISPRTSDSPYEDLLQWDGDNKVRLIGFLKEKDKWIEINTYLKGLGFTWKKDGSDSRWER